MTQACARLRVAHVAGFVYCISILDHCVFRECSVIVTVATSCTKERFWAVSVEFRVQEEHLRELNFLLRAIYTPLSLDIYVLRTVCIPKLRTQGNEYHDNYAMRNS